MFTLQDRTIYKDGKPILRISRWENENHNVNIAAWETDEYARTIVSLLNRLAPKHKWVSGGCKCHRVCMNCEARVETKDKAARTAPCPTPA